MSACPSVGLFVTHWYCVETGKCIIKLFHRRVATSFYQMLWQYSDGDRLTGTSNARKNCDFHTIYIHILNSCCSIQIVNPMSHYRTV